jgi:hypothetical protein
MYSIIRGEIRNGKTWPNIIMCRMASRKHRVVGIAVQLLVADANIHNGTANHTQVTLNDIGGWYEKLDGTQVRYYVEPE